MATDRHRPHAHHGKDLLILQASQVGDDPETGQFGTYHRIRTEDKTCPPTCGKIHSIIRHYQEEYRFDTENILLRKFGDDFLMTIDNRLLKDEHGVGQVWEQAELAERLLAQPMDNPELIDLEEAIAAMYQAPDIDIIWPS